MNLASCFYSQGKNNTQGLFFSDGLCVLFSSDGLCMCVLFQPKMWLIITGMFLKNDFLVCLFKLQIRTCSLSFVQTFFFDCIGSYMTGGYFSIKQMACSQRVGFRIMKESLGWCLLLKHMCHCVAGAGSSLGWFQCDVCRDQRDAEGKDANQCLSCGSRWAGARPHPPSLCNCWLCWTVGLGRWGSSALRKRRKWHFV